MIFKCSRNPLRSFWVLSKNQIIMISRSILGTILVTFALLFLFTALILGPFFLFDFPNAEGLKFILPIWLIFLFLYFFVYLLSLNFSRVFNVKGLEITEDGFFVIYKNSQREFIGYQNINSIYYEFYPYVSRFSRLLTPLLSTFWIFSRHFLIEFQNEIGNKNEVKIPLNITHVYQALDIIIRHIPEEKRGNVRVINGRVTASLDRKTFFIDLEKPSGKLILIILACIVLAFWIYLVLFLTK